MAKGVLGVIDRGCGAFLEWLDESVDDLQERILQTFCGVHEAVSAGPSGSVTLQYGQKTLVNGVDYIEYNDTMYVFKDSIPW